MDRSTKCEVCGRVATQADTNLNMWLCDDHYSKADYMKNNDTEQEAIEHAYLMKATFGKGRTWTGTR